MDIMRRLKAQGKFSNSMKAEIKEDDRVLSSLYLKFQGFLDRRYRN